MNYVISGQSLSILYLIQHQLSIERSQSQTRKNTHLSNTHLIHENKKKHKTNIYHNSLITIAYILPFTKSELQ